MVNCLLSGAGIKATGCGLGMFKLAGLANVQASRKFESFRAPPLPLQPRQFVSRFPRNTFPDRTKNSGNNPTPMVPPTRTGGVMDIVVAFLTLVSVGVFAVHTVDAIRTR
jgi:hypothetical protein